MANKKKAPRTVEPQYDVTFAELEKKGPVPMGPVASYMYRGDVRRLAIFLSRYKFVSKMLAGKGSAVEIGCGDGFGMRVVLQTVKRVDGLDIDPMFTGWCEEQAKRDGAPSRFYTVDLTRKTLPVKYEAAYSLDVIEHIPAKQEHLFVGNIRKCLTKDGVCIIGTPNISAHVHASPLSQVGHINLKSADTLKALLSRFFTNVFIFSMNDEVVHTGFYPMAHYLFALCTGPR
jgi:2-polyprenyl-3-methyl-5-hydroxy-6-metoxy-1,4-benzoquinol methylase